MAKDKAIVKDEILDEELPQVMGPPKGVVVREEEETAEGLTDAPPSPDVEKVIFTVDSREDDLLKWEKEGREIYFGDGGQFKLVPPHILRELSPGTKAKYFVAKGVTEESLTIGNTDQKDSVLRDLRQKYSVPGASTIQKLSIRGGVPNFEYSHFRVDRMGEAEERGWTPASTEEVKAYSANTTGTSIVLKDRAGNAELILMKKPKEAFEREQENGRAYRRMLRGKQSEADVKMIGKNGFDPDKQFVDKKWKPI